MRVELTKEFTFEAAHRLPRLPADHKCFRMHGHGFRVEIAVAGEIDPTLGWLVDYADIAARVEPIIRGELDHRTLNDVPGLENPTSEMLCVWLWRRLAPSLPGLAGVTVHETCTARCTYRGEGGAT
jgi:6-pyruvoyltetrahydropterin/6-carboxytetrahydropterin synthase